MSEKSVGQCWKSGIAAVGFALICSVSGCGDTPREEIYVEEAATETSVTQDNTTEKEEKLVKICRIFMKKQIRKTKWLTWKQSAVLSPALERTGILPLTAGIRLIWSGRSS